MNRLATIERRESDLTKPPKVTLTLFSRSVPKKEKRGAGYHRALAAAAQRAERTDRVCNTIKHDERGMTPRPAMEDAFSGGKRKR